ncbi:polysaccharide biosynthesis protein [Cohnella lupini]|uniref:FlaA1/EpsC-like NDP-sugar epimerase n=1 Tax=Cohnella lupini TaxID=1294267 RepID=A0A3D9IVE9_9BACL|nr:nucleoside-diphosphate sugar epimerase/dehydratase [Cohnella lupini]RED65813.1 FlaA1/EpsC-like NDP-sugar epimerase [Cohnella lupini]
MSYHKRNLTLILLDILLVCVSVYSSYFFRFKGDIPAENITQFIVYMIVSSIICTVCMRVFKLYNRFWQYASIGELISILKAVVISCLLAYIVTYLFVGKAVPLSIFARNAETLLLLLGGSRFIWRAFRDNYKKRTNLRKALIVGAGECGMLIAKELKFNKQSKVYPYAFIDDDMNKKNLQIYGLPVIGNRKNIPALVEKHGIEEIIIAIPSGSKLEISELIDICKRTKAQLKIIPPLQDIIQGKVTLNTIRNIQVEDLLGREPIETDLTAISSYLSNKTVLVTGAGGSIGSELCRQIASFAPEKLLVLGHGENSIYTIELELRRSFPNLTLESIIADVQDRERIDQVFKEFRPSVVFHAAAHKHVPLMERNPSEAVKNNVFGTKNVADCADLYGTERFVLISSDKAVNPSSVMGTTKRIAEMYIQSLNERSKTWFSAVRFGNVLGSRGSVIPLFKDQIARGGPVTVTHPEMVRYFMTIPEAVQLVIQCGALSEGGEIFVLDMGKPVRIVELAEDLIRMSGFEPYEEIPIEFSGIREGEKLFEELLFIEEEVTSTQHNRIFIGKLGDINQFQLELGFTRLEKVMVHEFNELRGVLEDLVPSIHRKVNYELASVP